MDVWKLIKKDLKKMKRNSPISDCCKAPVNLYISGHMICAMCYRQCVALAIAGVPYEISLWPYTLRIGETTDQANMGQ